MSSSAPVTDKDADRPGFPLDRIGLVLGPVTLIAWLAFAPQEWLLLPADAGLVVKYPEEARRLIGVLLLTVIWWLTEPIPIAATGLTAVVLCVALGAVPVLPGKSDVARTVLAPFADPSVYFLLGGTFIGAAMSKHGLDRRFALGILCTKWAGRSPNTILFAVGISVALVSMCISNTAATAMVYPVTMGIIAVLGAGRNTPVGFARSPFATMLLLITAYASSVGGIATPIGTATNVVAMGQFKQPDILGKSVNFLNWTMVGIPMMLVLYFAMFLWLRLQARGSGLDMPMLRTYLAGERAKFGRWNRGEKNVLAVFLIVISLWIAPGVLAIVAPGSAGNELNARQWYERHFPDEIIALFVPVALFLLPVDWRRRRFTIETRDLREIDWGTMLLFGAGLSLGNLMFQTGLANVLGYRAFEALGTRDIGVVTALAVAAGIFLSEFTSNAATAVTLIPVIAPICKQAGLDPTLPLMGVTFGASFGSALPVSTPPNAIVYGSGLIPVRRMIRAGLVLDIVCAVVIWTILMIAHQFAWTPFAN